MRRLILAVVALTLAACATVQKLDAAGDVHALLIAIRDNDGPAFDRRVDRRALMREISDRLAAQATKDPRVPAALAAILAPSLTRLAGDALIQPSVFRTVAEYYGYTPQTKIPGRVAISQTPSPDAGRAGLRHAQAGRPLPADLHQGRGRPLAAVGLRGRRLDAAPAALRLPPLVLSDRVPGRRCAFRRQGVPDLTP